MKTVGARLTLLYVGSVAVVLFGLLFLGYVLLERHLVSGLDDSLRARFEQLKDRIGTDITRGGDVRGLLAATQIDSSLRVEVDDLWNDPAYRDARLRGDPAPRNDQLSFFDRIGPTGAAERVIQGDNASLRVRIAAPLTPVREAVATYLSIGATIAGFTLLLSVLAGGVLSRFALRPVRAIERTARRISHQNLNERIPAGSADDEISRLARLLNETFERLETAFAEIRNFSADVSHEIKTPLSLVRLNLERVVLSGELTEGSRTSLVESMEEIDRLTRLVERLLFLARAEAGEVTLEKSTIEAHRFIEAFAHDAEALAEARGVHVAVLTNESGTVNCEPGRIRQVMLNLLSNALTATPAGGRITVRSSLSDGRWTVSIEDTGAGLPPEKCARIFERFVRSNPAPGSQGAGLGLAICKSIIELHGGDIAARANERNSGLTVEFTVPG